MLFYKNTSKDDIIQSIKVAHDYLIDLDCDDVILDHAEKLSDDVLLELENAQTTKEFSSILNQKIIPVLQPLRSLFTDCHGPLNTYEVGTQIAYDLLRWDGFGRMAGNTTPELKNSIQDHTNHHPTPDDAEKKTFLENRPAQVITKYGIEIDGTKGCTNNADRFYKDVFEKDILPQIQDFVDGDEYERTMIGAITHIHENPRDEKSGLSFLCSLECAQKIAELLPNYTVIDWQDNKIEAKPKKKRCPMRGVFKKFRP